VDSPAFSFASRLLVLLTLHVPFCTSSLVCGHASLLSLALSALWGLFSSTACDPWKAGRDRFPPILIGMFFRALFFLLTQRSTGPTGQSTAGTTCSTVRCS
jgi:hypothetical protein